MKRATVLLTFSAIILTGVFIFSQVNSSNNISSPEEQLNDSFVQDEDPLTVEYTNDGYVPQTLNVTRGETVTFINKSSRSMWVASDNHPTHTIYPEFDQKGLSRVEETYSFTFDNSGEWEYHDHLNPRADGLVIVE